MPGPGPLRSLGVPGPRRLAWVAGAALLTGLFVVRGLPYERLAPALSAAVARSSPFELRVQALGPSLSPLGPGVRATGLRLTAPDGAALGIDALVIRPAWSLRWLLLRPTFRIRAQLAGGTLDGTLGDEPSFAGALAGIDLAQLPVAALWPGGSLGGRADAEIDLRAGPAGPEGSVALAARDGSIGLPGAPLPLPFATLDARLALAGDAGLRIDALSLSGPGLEARAEGSVGRAAAFAGAPVDLRVELEADPAVGAGLRSLGIRLGRDGRASLHVTGTPARMAVE